MNHYTLSPEEIAINISVHEISRLMNVSESSMIIGQPRAVQALEMGTEIMAKGYNIFVTGISGTGRISAIKKILGRFDSSSTILKDIVYVFNFEDTDKPDILYFPKGEGLHFKKDIHTLVEDLKQSIRNMLHKRIYSSSRDELISNLEREENKLLAEFDQRIKKDNFQIVQTVEDDEEASDIQPIWKGEPITFDKLQDLVREGKIEEGKWNGLRKQYYEFMEEMRHIFLDINDKHLILEKMLHELKIKTIEPEIDRVFQKLTSRYDEKDTIRYLDNFKKDVIQNIFLFTQEEDEEDEPHQELLRYGVNLIVDNSRGITIPVIFENHPRYSNLFGSIETQIGLNGESRTNFMMIKAGSLLKASGGFIILKAEDVLKEEGTWENLKRTIQNGEIEIQNQNSAMNFQTNTLKPAPVSINAKIILVGNENLYEVLYNNDRDFQKYFKISAEFDSEMDLNTENLKQYIGFIKMIVSEEKLLSPDAGSILEIIAYGIRLAEHKEKLSTRLSLIADLVREASYWANKNGNRTIERHSVITALKTREYMNNMPEEKLVEFIGSGDILLTVSGEQIGRINGLAVHDRGFFSYGSPLVISAQVSPGNEGLINIEREVGLSGEIHDKGILIMEGYLRNKYAKDFPMSIYASICFEQSYGEVDGDSASSTEIYALLSAIADIPIKQSIAVTGSVNQMGQIQPVGGITEKVTGFYAICKRLGLTGEQGVIIPAQNIINLTLPEDVCEAVRKDEFFIYPVTTIDEGMEILTGMEAGARNRKGNFPQHAFNFLVENRLKEIAHLVKNYNG